MKALNYASKRKEGEDIFTHFRIDFKNKQIILKKIEEFHDRKLRPENTDKFVELDDELEKIHNFLYPDNHLDLSSTHYIKNIIITSKEFFYDNEGIYQIGRNGEKLYIYGKIGQDIKKQQSETIEHTEKILSDEKDLVHTKNINDKLKEEGLDIFFQVDELKGTLKNISKFNLPNNVIKQIYAIVLGKENDKSFIKSFYTDYTIKKVKAGDIIKIRGKNMYTEEGKPVVIEKNKLQTKKA